MVEHFHVKFGDPGCIAFGDIVWKKQTKTDRTTDTNTIKNRTPATTVGVGKNVYAKLSRKIIEDIQLK